MYFLWQDRSHGTVIFDLVTLTLKFDLLLKNFNLDFYLVLSAAWRASLSSDKSYYLVTLTLLFDLLLKNFNLDHNFQIRSDKAFIFL